MERDAESGLDYMLARYYSSSLGRFQTVDGLASSANVALPQSWNRYAYAWNNPLLLFDPTGEIVELTGKTEEEREAELEWIKHSLHDAVAAAQLKIQEVTNSNGSTSYIVAIEGDAKEFSSSSPTAELIGNAISSSKTIEFGFGSTRETRNQGGAYTYDREGGNSQIVIDPAHLEPWVGGVFQTQDTVVQHEFGHGMGIVTGDWKKRPMVLGVTPPSKWKTNPEALDAENFARAWYVKKAIQQFGKGSIAARAAQRVYGEERDFHY